MFAGGIICNDDGKWRWFPRNNREYWYNNQWAVVIRLDERTVARFGRGQNEILEQGIRDGDGFVSTDPRHGQLIRSVEPDGLVHRRIIPTLPRE